MIGEPANCKDIINEMYKLLNYLYIIIILLGIIQARSFHIIIQFYF